MHGMLMARWRRMCRSARPPRSSKQRSGYADPVEAPAPPPAPLARARSISDRRRSVVEEWKRSVPCRHTTTDCHVTSRHDMCLGVCALSDSDLLARMHAGTVRCGTVLYLQCTVYKTDTSTLGARTGAAAAAAASTSLDSALFSGLPRFLSLSFGAPPSHWGVSARLGLGGQGKGATAAAVLARVECRASAQTVARPAPTLHYTTLHDYSRLVSRRSHKVERVNRTL